MLESNPQRKQKVEQVQNEKSLLEDLHGSEARPGAVLVEGPAAPPAPLLLDPDPATDPMRPIEKSALSCQYKDKSFTYPQNCTPAGTYAGEKHGAKPVDNSPRSVVACHNKAWSLKLWKKSAPAEQINVPFTCRTWRHEGPCQKFKGAQDFVRIREGLQKYDGWVYIVLTYEDRRGSVDNIYRKIGRQLQHFRQWIQRNYAAAGEKVQYIALIEQHRDGFPHVNLLVHTRQFVNEAADNWKKLRRRVKRHATATGFGKIFWLQPMRDKEAMSAYFVKLCGEVSKMNQAPLKAPSNFRRLRSSVGLLPPVNKDPEMTGELLKVGVELAERMPAHRILLAAELLRIEENDKERRALRWYDAIEMLKDGAIYSPFRLKLFA